MNKDGILALKGRYTFSPARERQVAIDNDVEALKGRHIDPANCAFNMSPLQGFNLI
jgi:hypothetical protein